MRVVYIVGFVFAFASCQGIETADSLSKTDMNRLRTLNLIEEDEKLLKFYSEFKKSTAGNFYTDKRMAKYWIDDRNSLKDQLHSAFYHEIKSIDTVYYAGLTYAPYMLVTKKDNTRFKVCVEGTREEIRLFFEDALKQWDRKK